MKITLISPFPEITCFGIRSISEYLEINGSETQIIFLPDPEFETQGKRDEERIYPAAILNEIGSHCQGADLVGLSLFSNNLRSAIQLTESLKKSYNGPIVWGGKHPSVMPEMCLEYVDMVAIGESEIPMVELCKKIEAGQDYYDVKGFWFKHDGEIKKNPVGALVKNLDDIPISNYVSDSHYVWDKNENKLLAMNEGVLERFIEDNPFTGGKAYVIMTSRGCPFSCSYCSTYKPMYKGQKYVRRRSAENVIEELSQIKRQFASVDQISFADDEFMSAGVEYIQKFCRLYKQKVNLPFHCLFHPATVTEEKLELLVDAGLSVVQMGIQTGSERTLKLYRRNVSNKKTLEAVKLINKYKQSILPLYDFIIDNPYEDRQDLVDTIKFINQFPDPYTLTVFSLVFFPGTELFNKAVEDGLIDPLNIDDYLKKYQHFSTRYLNLVISLLKIKIPSRFINVLVSQPFIFVFDRPAFTIIFSYSMHLYRIIKRLLKLKRPSGGFEIDKRVKQITDGDK